MPKPKPVVVSTVCSECGLPWEDHGDTPTLADCVRLLKARPPQVINYPYHWSYTNTVEPYRKPYEIVCDTPAMLTPGEFIVRSSSVATTGHLSIIDDDDDGSAGVAAIA